MLGHTGTKPFDPQTDTPPGDIGLWTLGLAVTGWKAYRFLTSHGRERRKYGKQLVAAVGLDALILGYLTTKYAGA